VKVPDLSDVACTEPGCVDGWIEKEVTTDD
jgi:hypothetical protein